MIILACEGKTEVYLMMSLIEKGIICFDAPIFLGKPLVMRQIQKYKAVILTLPINEEIIVYRIGDTLTDELDLRGFELRNIKEVKICTRPEIEMLIIIEEGLLHDYEKVKSRIRPKQYLFSKRPDIDVEDYFDSHDMSRAILEYKRVFTHRKGEGFLADLLKKKLS